MNLRSACTSILFLFVTGILGVVATPPLTADNGSEQVNSIYEAMSTEERLAQLLLVAWQGESPSELIMEWIETRGLGGVKVFGWNANDTTTLARSIGEMQSAAIERRVGEAEGIPLLTATDQEGGWVRHIRGRTSTSAGNMAIGATQLPSDAYRTGKYIAEELRALGINVNFAPTVDVYRNAGADVIGSRSFGDNPEQVGVLGLGFFRGHENEGVIAAAKHFPGHGNAIGDSHGLLPQVTESFDEFYGSDLIPYRMLMNEGLPAVLSAHVAYPGLSGSSTPATLSPEIMQGVLRDTLGFEGIAISDDMHMGGATLYAEQQGWSFGELQVRAIEAGNDMLVLSQTPALNGEIWSALTEAYEQRPGFRDRVEESVKRILRIKAEYLQTDSAVPLVPDTSELSNIFPHEEARAFFEDHATRAVSMVRDDKLPVEPEEYDSVLLAGNVRNFFTEARRHFPQASESRFSYAPRDYSLSEERETVREDAAQADLIVFGLSNRNSLEVLQELEAYADSIVVISTLSPLLLAEADFVDSAVAVYGLGRESFRAGFDVLTGRAEAQGTVPLRTLRETRQ